MAYVIKLKRSNNSLVVKHVTRNVTLQHVGRRGAQGIQGIQGPPGSDADALVSSVNGELGDVVLNQDDVLDGTTYKQYSQTEKTKLAGIAIAATANSSDAYLLARANHTGTQAISTILNLQAAIDTIPTELDDLSDVTIDTPLDGQVVRYESGGWLNTQVEFAEIGGSPASNSNLMDEFNLKENLITPGTSSQYYRGDKTFQTLDKTAVGLPNVDNTSDANKPISTATQTALNTKANDSDVVHDTGNETIAGVKTFSSDPVIPDEAYGVGWNGVLEPPTKNALYDKIETKIEIGGDIGGTVLNPTINNHAKVYNVKDYGAVCDGGCSQSGILDSSSIITDTTPSEILPLSDQTLTWVGRAAAVGGGISGVTMASSGAAPIVTTNSSHGLTTGQMVFISGIVGTIELNATWVVTVLTSTTFSVPLNTARLSTYTSGGVILPQLVINGFVSNPIVSLGTLTFTIVTSLGGSTPATIPVGFSTSGSYYYGTDDTDAWNAAITEAEDLSNSNNVSNIVTWSGTSMVSSQITVNGNILLRGGWMDYTNPNGTDALSSYPQRGSILRAIGTFSNKTTAALVQLGTSNSIASGNAGTSTLYGTYDAANICQSALRTFGTRNWSMYTYALNGTMRAFDWQGGNCVAVECIAGQSNTGDGLYSTNGDSKWKGGYIRQACNGIHYHSINGAGDLWVGNGTHIFSGYNGGNEQFGNDILIDNGGGNISINNIILDGTNGPQIRIAPAAGASQISTIITGINAFHPTNTGGVRFPFLQIDTSAAGSVVGSLLLDSYILQGNATDKYLAIMELLGSGTQTKIILGSGIVNYSSAFYITDGIAPRPQSISSEIALFNGEVSKYSSMRGVWNSTGDGVTSTFTLSHTLGISPNDIQFGPQTVGSVGVFVTVDASNIYFKFPTAPANNVPLGVWYKATI